MVEIPIFSLELLVKFSLEEEIISIEEEEEEDHQSNVGGSCLANRRGLTVVAITMIQNTSTSIKNPKTQKLRIATFAIVDNLAFLKTGVGGAQKKKKKGNCQGLAPPLRQRRKYFTIHVFVCDTTRFCWSSTMGLVVCDWEAINFCVLALAFFFLGF